MIADPTSVILTAHVAHWADEHPARTAWLINCLHRHNTGDWGDLDHRDAAVNDHALRSGEGRVLSSYVVPREITAGSSGDEVIWIITDDIADPEAVTTILWPSDY